MGVSLGLIVVAVGGAVDLTQATAQRTTLQRIADASSIAGARLSGATEQERREAASNHFQNSRMCRTTNCTVDVSFKGEVLTIDAAVDVSTSIMKVVGVKDVPISVTSSAMAGAPGKLDVAMMLDYSGSMGWKDKYVAMGAAAKSFIDQVEAGTQSKGRVAVVPFSEYVLAPMQGRYVYDVANGSSLSGETIFGCLLNRQHPYSVSADTPNTATEGALWPALSYVKADVPTDARPTEDYAPGSTIAFNTLWQYSIMWAGMTMIDLDLDIYDDPIDGISGSTGISSGPLHPMTGLATYTIDGNNNVSYRLNTSAFTPAELDHVNQHVNFTNFNPLPDAPGVPLNNYAGSDGWSTPPDASLPPEFDQALSNENLPPFCQRYVDSKLWVRPLSVDYDGLRDALSEMAPNGLTNIALALDLGWHTLTPNAPYEETEKAADGDAEGAERIAVLLTDGVQTVKAHGTTGSYNVDSANANIAESCEAMKASGIKVFTIAFDIGSDATRKMLFKCSSGEKYFHEPKQSAELEDVFGAIFDQIASSGARIVN